MVTSNKAPEKKVVKMEDSNNGVVVPQRTLLGEVNEHITCPLCRGYYIDATTIVECLHSFCRSCIIKHLKVKSYCPVCEMMINSAKPNIKLDKALQDIVYKLVPGLFQKEMERRQHFYASRPGPAATATPEQRGEDTERIIFSPEDVISFSLEYSDATDTDSVSSKSSDSNDPPAPASTRRYLQCPAVVNISHLKKFLSMKFDIDNSQFAIVILYKRVPLPDYYTLMDIAYIYNWKRNEPMRFIYQIIDYIAIRNRIFDINRKGSQFNENKPSPSATDDTNANSPVSHLNDQGSEISSGTDSPMPDDNNTKPTDDLVKPDQEKQMNEAKEIVNINADKITTLKKSEDEVEKSQFLNSFELTAKSNCVSKPAPVKSTSACDTAPNESGSTKPVKSPKKDDKHVESLKRKQQTQQNAPELKKLRIELEKTKITNILNSYIAASAASSSATTQQNTKVSDMSPKGKDQTVTTKNSQEISPLSNLASAPLDKDLKQIPTASIQQQQASDSSAVKRSVTTSQHIASPKRKPSDVPSTTPSLTQKTISPLKIQVPKLEPQTTTAKPVELPKPSIKKIPDLKPSLPPPQSKAPQINKFRMDLLANNSDPTIDRSKILSQVKTSLSSQNVTTSGDPLKSLFDSCKLNIPSSLSITLTDQKIDPRSPGDSVSQESKKIVNKNLAGASNSLSHKVPSPPVHNYIEILKLPDNDSKKSNKEVSVESKPNSQNKNDSATPPTTAKPVNKTSESSAKGPIPNLKPIADTKLAKQQVANYAGPITFQQTFEQQLQSLQGDKKSKGPKNKAQVPKLMPATPKALSAVNKPSSLNNKPTTVENKTSTALDLSTQSAPPSIPQKINRTLETMQTITNLAKKQNLPPKGMSPSMSQSSSFSGLSRPTASGVNQLRIPSANAINQMKLEKGPGGPPITSTPRNENVVKSSIKASNNLNPGVIPSNYQIPHVSPGTTQPSPRQTRSPSSSPKLVIAEEKQSTSNPLEQSMNQSNQITSSQISNQNSPKSEPPSATAGPSSSGMKSLKPPISKLNTNRQPVTPAVKQSSPMRTPVDYLSRPQFIHNALLMRQQLEMNAAWMKAQRQYDFDIYKNITNLAHQSQNDFNKDKQ